MDRFTVVAILVVCIFGALVVWLSAGFIRWGDKAEGFFCLHDIEEGGGGMGDAVECSKCELRTYDGFNSHLWIFRLLGRVRKL
jgi:hypothetical protein